MTPDSALGSLNRVLAQEGEDVVLARPSVTTDPASVLAQIPCRAFVRPLPSAGNVGTINVIMSPTDIINGDWAVKTMATGSGDPNVPRITDKLFVQGRRRDIMAVRPIYIAGVLVRIEVEATA